MSETIPLGQPESERLEFKAKSALADLPVIGREVVAMLNSLDEGGAAGEIWIGIDDPARGWTVQPIDDPDRERRRVQDYLVDSIEPRPGQGEVSVSTEPAPQGGSVLVVKVQHRNASRRPFALVRSNVGRLFLRRFSDRNVLMSREELADAFGKTQGSSPTPAMQALNREVAAQPPGRLWLALEPDPGGEINFAQDETTALLSDPTRTGTPRSSFNVTEARLYGPADFKGDSKGRNRLYLGNDRRSLILGKSGGLRFVAALDDLSTGQVPFVQETKLLSPERLLGYTISTLRLAAGLLKDERCWHGSPPRGIVWAWLAAFGLEGWGLLPGDLMSWPAWRHQVRRYAFPDFVPESPLAFATAEVIQGADRCGLRLFRLLYEAFGLYREEDLPTLGGAGLISAG